jgi:hypothetical protein
VNNVLPASCRPEHDETVNDLLIVWMSAAGFAERSCAPVWTKLQIPNPNPQITSTLPNSNARWGHCGLWALEFGFSLEFGIWNLEFLQ